MLELPGQPAADNLGVGLVGQLVVDEEAEQAEAGDLVLTSALDGHVLLVGADNQHVTLGLVQLKSVDRVELTETSQQFVHREAPTVFGAGALHDIVEVPEQRLGVGRQVDRRRLPEVRARLMPSTPWGCHRPLFSNDYYPAFNLPHVELVTESIEALTASGVQTVDGTERQVDTIVFATGYETTKFASVIDFVGCDGMHLRDVWAEGAQAYLGITASGFPNLFMLYGPNTNAGSIMYMIECQVDYVVRLLQAMEREGLASVDVRPDVMAAYNDQLQQDIDGGETWPLKRLIEPGPFAYSSLSAGRPGTPPWP